MSFMHRKKPVLQYSTNMKVESSDKAKAVYPKGFLCGFEVRPHVDGIKQLPKEIQSVPKEKR